jgi:hypothetical protein
VDLLIRANFEDLQPHSATKNAKTNKTKNAKISVVFISPPRPYPDPEWH